jgi:hypothetical protein
MGITTPCVFDRTHLFVACDGESALPCGCGAVSCRDLGYAAGIAVRITLRAQENPYELNIVPRDRDRSIQTCGVLCWWVGPSSNFSFFSLSNNKERVLPQDPEMKLSLSLSGHSWEDDSDEKGTSLFCGRGRR